jgi:hypothetical protein
MKLDCTSAAILSLSFATVSVLASRPFFPSSLPSQRYQQTTISHGWTTSRTSHIISDKDIPSWYMSIRGGSTTSTSDEPNVDGTIQSLYLPGLLDVSIHRPNTVSIKKSLIFNYTSIEPDLITYISQ